MSPRSPSSRSLPPSSPKLPFQQITSPPPNPLTLKLQMYIPLIEQFDSVELLTTLAHAFVHRLATPAKDSKSSSQFLKSNIMTCLWLPKGWDASMQAEIPRR